MFVKNLIIAKGSGIKSADVGLPCATAPNGNPLGLTVAPEDSVLTEFPRAGKKMAEHGREKYDRRLTDYWLHCWH